MRDALRMTMTKYLYLRTHTHTLHGWSLQCQGHQVLELIISTIYSHRSMNSLLYILGCAYGIKYNFNQTLLIEIVNILGFHNLLIFYQNIKKK